MSASGDGGAAPAEDGGPQASDAGVPECTTAAMCTNPGPCGLSAGAACTNGHCVYPTKVCTTPPATTCVQNDSVLRAYASPGKCDPTSGACIYELVDTPCMSCVLSCLQVCQNFACPNLAGGCLMGLCVPTATDVPPKPSCTHVMQTDGASCMLTAAAGVCHQGQCVECAKDGDGDDYDACTLDQCTNFQCRHTPIVCGQAPGPCFSSPGICSPSTGQCVYAPLSAGAPCDADSNRCTLDQCDGQGSCVYTGQPALCSTCGCGPLYRVYSSAGTDHFYTVDLAKRDNAIMNLGFVDQGIAAHVELTMKPGSIPLYRLYDARTTDHLYTTSMNEVMVAMADGYQLDRIEAYVYPTGGEGLVPLYRVSSLMSTTDFDRLYTTNPAERDSAVQAGWTYEGVACYVYPP